MASEGELRNRKPLEQSNQVEALDEQSDANHDAKEPKTIGRTPDGTGISQAPFRTKHDRLTRQ